VCNVLYGHYVFACMYNKYCLNPMDKEHVLPYTTNTIQTWHPMLLYIYNWLHHPCDVQYQSNANVALTCKCAFARASIVVN